VSAALGKALPFDSLAELRRHLVAAHPVLGHPDAIAPTPWGEFGAKGNVDPAPFVYPIADFYATDPVSRASPTMAECREAFGGAPETELRTGTHG
jgi:NADH-quinone oxidoreductase subunit G